MSRHHLLNAFLARQTRDAAANAACYRSPHTRALRERLRRRLLQSPRFVRWGIRIDHAPAWYWLALLAASLWPAWWWMAQGVLEGLGDPVALLVLGALGSLVWQSRQALVAAPRLSWLAASLCLAIGGTVLQVLAAQPIAALTAVLALGCGVLAMVPTLVPQPSLIANRFVHRVVLKGACALLLPVCLLVHAAGLA